MIQVQWTDFSQLNSTRQSLAARDLKKQQQYRKSISLISFVTLQQFTLGYVLCIYHIPLITCTVGLCLLEPIL